MRFLWGVLGVCAVILAIIGIVTPLLPTVPFLLLAAFSFSKSSTQLHTWLMEHPRLGPPIRNWEAHGAISTMAKKLSTVSMIAVLAISWLLNVPVWLLGIQAVVLTCAAAFIWSRPSV